MKASRSVTLACAILSVFMLLCSCGGSGGGSTASPSPASPSAASPSQTILPHEWTWTSGSDTVNHSGAYGATTGTPGTPGTRMTSASWTDPAGNFWLFGGYGYDSVGDNGVLNDLWEFNPATATWTWMSGSNTRNQSGTYGATTGTTGTPGARLASASWADSAGNLWLFGGDNGTGFVYNDLWKFNPSTSTWTWVSGSNNINQGGTYGATTGTTGKPGARAWPAFWTDSAGKFWLFGGYGEDAGSNSGDLNDLWEFDPSTTTWTWVSGGNAEGQSGTYGVMTGTTGTPGCRYASISWIDLAGNSPGSSADTATIRRVVMATSTTSGNSIRLPARGPAFRRQNQGKPGTYGATTGTTGTPGCRGWSASWTDSAGKSGSSAETATIRPAIMATSATSGHSTRLPLHGPGSGSNTINQSVSYGGAAATPGGRNSPVSRIDLAGNSAVRRRGRQRQRIQRLLGVPAVIDQRFF